MDKKTVGIVTFHTADNYGAVLQAYALQHYIEFNIGHDVKIIDFNTTEHKNEHTIFKRYGLGLIRDTIYNLCSLLYYFNLKRRISRFEVFRSKFFHLTSHQYDSESDFRNNMEPFDYYISGSDQVFNPGAKFSECYYLAISDTTGKKIAYAPSFGIESFTKEQIETITRNVKNFDVLSCREQIGSSLLSSIIGKNIPTVCDPVFLLDKTSWNKIACTKENKRPFIFIYDLNGGYDLIPIAKRIKTFHPECEIICCTTKTRVFYQGCTIVRDLGPQEFLGYLSSASFVVTDSFHGTALSIILGKVVYTYIAASATSSRIKNLADILGTTETIITCAEDIQFKQENIDCSDKLTEYVARSKQYLDECLFSNI